MGMSLSEFEAILRELAPVLTGGWIQKIHQPRPFLLTFDIRVPGATHRLLVCVEPKFARLHLTTGRFDNPLSPLPFCLFLRSHLDGGRIHEIKQEPNDRVLYLTVVKGEIRYILVVALTGNRSNVLIVDEEQTILRSLRDGGKAVGARYAPPLKPREAAPGADVSFRFAVSTSPVEPVPHAFLDRAERNFAERFPVSWRLEQRYQEQEEGRSTASFLQQHTARTRKALKQATKKLQALDEDLRKFERYREYQRYGELLKSQLSSLRKGQEQVKVVDYYDPSLPELTLPLDPTKDPVWNMEEYFRKFHKFQSAQEHLLPRVNAARQAVTALEAKLADLEQGNLKADQLPQLRSRREGLSQDSVQKPSARRREKAQGYRTYTSLDGLPILVGKTAKDNDYLTFKVGKPDDLWLHARGTPGSHVIVRLEKGTSVPPETLRDAATLTLWFSDLRKSGKGEVIYSLRKFVKKGKGFKPGSVTVSREKSLWIELKEDRLERLKEKTD